MSSKLFIFSSIILLSGCNQNDLTIQRNHDQPFFAYLPYNMPHNPLHASPDFKGKSRNGIYGDAIEEIDFQ